MEETLEKVFGEKVKETLRNTSEDAIKTRAIISEAVPSEKEPEERNLDHGVFRSWARAV